MLYGATIACLILWLAIPRKEVVTVTDVKIDTLETVDTILITKTKVVERLTATIDTVFVDTSEVIIAKADTLMVEDSSRIEIAYYFPPKNYFDVSVDLKEKIIERTKVITEVQTVEKPNYFYEDEWFYSTAILTAIIIIQALNN